MIRWTRKPVPGTSVLDSLHPGIARRRPRHTEKLTLRRPRATMQRSAGETIPRIPMQPMTDTAAAPSTRPAAFGDLGQELAATRRVLDRVPDEHWDWKPHEKSMSLGRLAGHLAELPYLAVSVLQEDVFDVMTRPRPAGPA